MTLAEATERLVRATGHDRFRDLVATDPARWGPVILKRAAALDTDPPAPVENPHMAASRLARDSPHRSHRETCGCAAGMAICALGKVEFPTDGKVSFGFCLRCVKGEA